MRRNRKPWPPAPAPSTSLREERGKSCYTVSCHALMIINEYK